MRVVNTLHISENIINNDNRKSEHRIRWVVGQEVPKGKKWKTNKERNGQQEFVWVVGRVALKEKKKERKKETDSEHRIRLSCRSSSSKV